jgi:hypothetical protein
MMSRKKTNLLSRTHAHLTCYRFGSLLRSLELLSATLLIGFALQDASAAPRPPSSQERMGERGKREELEKQISKLIQPPSEDEWNQIVGDKASLKFPVSKGNTLYGISKELFGDAKYWPKIWALNNGAILNPHVIRPGQVVAFLGGSSSTLPGVTVIDAGKEDSAAEAPPNETPLNEASATETPEPAINDQVKPDIQEPSSEEWKRLPAQQGWEYQPLTPETINAELRKEKKDSAQAPLRADRMRSWPDRGIQLESIPMTDKMESIGTITGSRSEGLLLGKGDMVYLEADGNLTIGETYSVIRKDPTLIKSRKSDRSGWSHENLGTIRILSIKDGVYVGQILESFWEIQRGDVLVPYINKATAKRPIPGPAPIEGTLLLYRSTSLFATSQYKQVFIDRGREDGVQPGMVFRSYQYWDPGTGARFTDSDFIIDADLLIIHATEEFSIAIVLSSLSPVVEGSTLVLLTDVSDVLTKNGYRARTEEEVKRDAELDELDRLPPASSLEEDERKELEQLEKWKKNPEGTEAVQENQLEDKALNEDEPPEDLSPDADLSEPVNPPDASTEESTEKLETPPTTEASEPTEEPTEKPTEEPPPPPPASPPADEKEEELESETEAPQEEALPEIEDAGSTPSKDSSAGEELEEL